MVSEYVDFKVDFVREAEYLPHIVSLAGRSALTPRLIGNFHSYGSDGLLSRVKKMHVGNEKRFEAVRSYYEGLWGDVGESYVDSVSDTLGFQIEDSKTCYIVPSLSTNIADVLGRENAFIVAAERQQVPLDFILLHELTHLHYADAVFRSNSPDALRSPLVEGVDHLVLFKTPVYDLFSGIEYRDLSFVSKNQSFMDDLESVWNEKKDFSSFLEKAVDIQLAHPGVVMR